MTELEFIRLVDELETRAAGYLTLAELELALNRPALPEITAGLLLLDHRERIDEPWSATQPITLCRLNRQHPTVRDATAW